MSGLKDFVFKHGRGKSHLWVVLFFLLLTLAVTWPLVLHLTDRVPGWFIADNYEYIWKMWWFKHAIIDVHQSPLFAPDIFYPQGFHLAHAELSPLHTVVGLPLTWLWGEVPTYNVFSMLSFVLTGWATYALLYRMTGNHWAGLLAGTVLTLTPYHTVRYGGILPLMSIQGIPIFFLYLEIWIEEHRCRWAALAGVGFLLSAWASLYYAAGIMLLAPVYALIRMQPIRAYLKNRRIWIGLSTIVIIILLGLVPLVLPYLELRQEVNLQIPLDDVDFWSASLSDYLLPPGLHPIWGKLVREKLLSIPEEYPQISLEFVLGVGWVGLLFAIYGWRRSRHPARAASIWLLAAALVLSFGPRLHLGRHPLVITAPKQIVNTFHHVLNIIGAWLPSNEGYQLLQAEGITVPLPALFLRWIMPFLGGMRAWNRFAVFVSLALSYLAGLGFSAWISDEIAAPNVQGSRRLTRVRWAGVIVLTFAIFELWPGKIPLQPVEPRPVDYWLAEQPGQFTIMELPLTSALSAPQMLYTRFHGKRIAFAYGTYFPYWYREQYPELKECPEKACINRLQEWDVNYLLLNKEALPPGSRLEVILDRSEALIRYIMLDDVVVYELQYDLSDD
ncbi:MAG: hypothetical protein E3J37_04025 [Anaerolineales bacterium]|nr:MAG: hypothetical protein E3J37_04025 [Anaerolineales bacterium]